MLWEAAHRRRSILTFNMCREKRWSQLLCSEESTALGHSNIAEVAFLRAGETTGGWLNTRSKKRRNRIVEIESCGRYLQRILQECLGRCLYRYAVVSVFFFPSSKPQSLSRLPRHTHTHTAHSVKLNHVTESPVYGGRLFETSGSSDAIANTTPLHIHFAAEWNALIWCDTVTEPQTAIIILRLTVRLSRCCVHTLFFVPFHSGVQLTL